MMMRSIMPLICLLCAFACRAAAQPVSPQAEDGKTDSGLQQSPLEKSPLEKLPLENETTGADQDDVLAPWEEEEINNELPDLRSLTPRDLLVDIDDGELEHLYDYQPVEPGNPALIKILFRLQRFSLTETQMFAARTMETSLANIAEASDSQRLKIFAISGRATKVSRVRMVDRFAELYQLVGKDGEVRDFDAYYQVEVELEPDARKAIVCCTSVPHQWLTAREIDEPFSASAMYLKINSRKSEPLELLFATNRMEWYPETATLDETIHGGPLLLSQYGFDVSLLEDAAKRNRQSINAVDADCFYRMLGAVSAMQQDRANPTAPEFELVELMNNPAPHHGDIYMIDADIRRVTRVDIDDPYYRDHLTIGHYYQLDGFVDTTAIISDPRMEKVGLPDYGKRYPVSICVPKLPPGMRVNSSQMYRVRIPVFYFKTWKFRSQLSRSHDPGLKHIAPLMIGLQPTVETGPSYSSSFTVALLSIVCVLMFSFIWFGFWKQSRERRLSGSTRFQLGDSQLAISESDPEERGSAAGQSPATATNDGDTISDFPRLQI